MQIANLVDAASKMFNTKRELEVVLQTWISLGKEQNALPEYMDKMRKAVELLKEAGTLEEGLKAFRRAEVRMDAAEAKLKVAMQGKGPSAAEPVGPAETVLTDNEKRAAAEAKIASGLAALKAAFESGRMFTVKKMQPKPTPKSPPNVTIEQAMKALFPTMDDYSKTLYRLMKEEPVGAKPAFKKIQQMAIKMRAKMMAHPESYPQEGGQVDASGPSVMLAVGDSVRVGNEPGVAVGVDGEHESTFTEMRNAYGRSTTKNTAKSLEDYGKSSASASLGGDTDGGNDQLRAVPARGEQGRGGDTETGTGRRDARDQRGGTGTASGGVAPRFSQGSEVAPDKQMRQ